MTVKLNQYLETERDGKPIPYSEGIRDIRLQMGLDREQMAEKLGLSKRTIEAYEYDQRKPSIMILVLLKKIMEK